MAQKLVVIIPTSGRSILLNNTLDSLAKCKKPAIYDETILVENGPKSGVEEIALKYNEELNTRYVYVSIGNKSNALNNALKTVKDSLVYFTDDDVRLEPGVLEAYAVAAGEKLEGEFYGGPFQAEYVRKPPEWLNEFLPVSAVGWSLGEKPKYIEKGNLFIGFNWAAFDKDVKRLGGFSLLHGPGSKIGAVGQETEMQKRLLENGVKGNYVPEAKVWHLVPPERCSPEFTAKRAFKWGIQNGLDYNGSITRLWRRSLIDGVRAFAGLAQREPPKRFKPYYKFCFSSGMVKGKFISKRNYINNQRSHDKE